MVERMGASTQWYSRGRGRALICMAQANDNLGYIGAGIVGAFAVIVAAWYAVRWARRRCWSARA
jgi:hypothetical protein